MHRFAGSLLILTLFFAGRVHAAGNDTTARGSRDGSIVGLASFYSMNLDGTKTSTGEIFRIHEMTAASNRFKLNTWVTVTNLKNDRSVLVRINDHMHKRMSKQGRVVDLSFEAARRLGFVKRGLIKVRVTPTNTDRAGQ